MGIEIASSFKRKAPVPIDEDYILADIAARDAIDPGVRYIGLEVIVLDSGDGTPKKYWLVGGIDDADWEEFSSGGGGASYRPESGTFTNAANKVIPDDKDVLIMSAATPGVAVATQTITLPTGELTNSRVVTIISRGEATTLTIDGDGNQVNFAPNFIKPGDSIQYFWNVANSTWQCISYVDGGGADTKLDITANGAITVKNVPKQLIRLNPNNEYTMTIPNGTIRQQLLYLRIFDIGSCRFQGWPANNTSNITLKDRASEVIMSQNDQMTLLWDKYEELWYQI